MLCPFAGNMKNMYFNLQWAQPATGSLVVSMQFNAVDTALTITIPASSPAGLYTDLTHVVSCPAGQYVRFYIHNNAAANSGGISDCVMEFERTTT